jgi:hypothetical protein
MRLRRAQILACKTDFGYNQARRKMSPPEFARFVIKSVREFEAGACFIFTAR